MNAGCVDRRMAGGKLETAASGGCDRQNYIGQFSVCEVKQ